MFWEAGYESTSPQAIMDRGRAGQGSFYHHFGSKRGLAISAFDATADTALADLEAVLSRPGPGLERVVSWLRKPRRALRGCRIGRHAAEASVVADGRLREPLERYFRGAERALRSALEDARREGQLREDLDPASVALTLLAVVQGGYVLSRATGDPAKLDRAIEGALRLLREARSRAERA
jgi:AcrR family transcriptional regulator